LIFSPISSIIKQDFLSHVTNGIMNTDNLKITATGASGLVGTALLPFLRMQGHDANRLIRVKDSRSCCDFYWNPEELEVDASAFEGVDAVVHLSGENIAGRWSTSKRRKIRDSRIRSTAFLSEAIAGLGQPPKVLICASAVGYYGDGGSEWLAEDSEAGTGFLAEVCQEWEAATSTASSAGIRVVNLRIGMVLSAKGGALARMLLPFKMGLGGIIGSGEQYWSWISIEDLCAAIHHVIVTETLSGPVNAVAPNPVTNREFTKALGAVLSRPTALPMPAFAVRLAFGEMADALLLASSRVKPAKLLQTGCTFQHANVEDALHHLLGN